MLVIFLSNCNRLPFIYLFFSYEHVSSPWYPNPSQDRVCVCSLSLPWDALPGTRPGEGTQLLAAEQGSPGWEAHWVHGRLPVPSPPLGDTSQPLLVISPHLPAAAPGGSTGPQTGMGVGVCCALWEGVLVPKGKAQRGVPTCPISLACLGVMATAFWDPGARLVMKPVCGCWRGAWKEPVSSTR